jgi:hypothetical protein
MFFLRNKDKKTREIASEQGGETYRANPNFTSDGAQAMFSEKESLQGRGYSTSYTRVPRFNPDYFLTLEDGEGLLTLPPRFGDNQIQMVQFKGHSIEDLDGANGSDLPGAGVEV